MIIGIPRLKRASMGAVLKNRTLFSASGETIGVLHMSDLPLIVFDVNETLLDLRTMEPTFERIFGDRKDMRLWFANLIMYSAALTVAGCYVPFTDIGAAVMRMLADTRGIKISGADKQELKDKFSTMPPYAEVPDALRKMRQAGFKLFTLTDNLLEVQTQQLTHGGIVDLFDRRFSADGVKHHKPSHQACLCREGAWGLSVEALSDRVPHLGHARRGGCRMGSGVDQTCRQRRP
jgi:2-haloacid dehalogenase